MHAAERPPPPTMHVRWTDRALNSVFCHYDNKNSLTRDELANERSFLAYIRCTTTLLVSSFSITQVVLQMIIFSVRRITAVDGVAGGSSSSSSDTLPLLIAAYASNIHDYTHYFKPTTLLICAVAGFCSCLGLKKAWLNFYNLAERAKFQPGLIGMGLLFLSVFVVDVVLLRQSIAFGLREFAN